MTFLDKNIHLLSDIDTIACGIERTPRVVAFSAWRAFGEEGMLIDCPACLERFDRCEYKLFDTEPDNRLSNHNVVVGEK